MLTLQELKKTVIIFGFEDVLIPGKVITQVNTTERDELLKNLKAMEESIPAFHMVLVSGLPEAIALEKINEAGLQHYFKQENIHAVSDAYNATKEEIDLKRYTENIAENPEFKDEYFKTKIILQAVEQFQTTIDKIIYIGHDLWSEGYYLTRFTGVDFVLIEAAVSHLDVKHEKIKGVAYIALQWQAIEKILKGDFQKPDKAAIKNYAYTIMKDQLFEGQNIGAQLVSSLKHKNEKKQDTDASHFDSTYITKEKK